MVWSTLFIAIYGLQCDEYRFQFFYWLSTTKGAMTSIELCHLHMLVTRLMTSPIPTKQRFNIIFSSTNGLEVFSKYRFLEHIEA